MTDGTAAGTLFLNNDISISYINTKSAQGNGILYYVINNFNDDRELWRTDGTVQGTYNITPPELTHWIEHLAFYNGRLYFAGESKVPGDIELWVSDGTLQGTHEFIDIYPGSKSSQPERLTVANGKLYFPASSTSSSNRNLYVSDGSVTGTHSLKEGTLTVGGYVPTRYFLEYNGLVFFGGTDVAHGSELWQTDGTEAGTKLCVDIKPGSGSSAAQVMYASATKIYFSTDEFHFWSTDATAAGTQDLGISGNYPDASSFHEVNGMVFFSNGEQVWQTDGSACHSKEVTFFPGVQNAPELFFVKDNALFLRTNSVEYGSELFSIAVAPSSLIEICNGLDDDCNGLIDDGAPIATITPSGIVNACDGELVALTASPTGDDLSYQWFYNGSLINGVTSNTLSSSTLGGSVDVVINSSFGCSDTSDATIVNRIPLPKAKITAQGDLDICATGSVILKTNSGNGYTYQWKLNNTIIPGATKKQYTAAVGNYKVEVTNNNDCSKTSNKVAVFTSCKETGEATTENSITAYPNPFHQSITIDLSPFNLNGEQVQILFTDLSGKIILKKQISGQSQIEIDDAIPNGFYLVEVKLNGWKKIIPVVKE